MHPQEGVRWIRHWVEVAGQSSGWPRAVAVQSLELQHPVVVEVGTLVTTSMSAPLVTARSACVPGVRICVSAGPPQPFRGDAMARPRRL